MQNHPLSIPEIEAWLRLLAAPTPEQIQAALALRRQELLSTWLRQHQALPPVINDPIFAMLPDQLALQQGFIMPLPRAAVAPAQPPPIEQQQVIIPQAIAPRASTSSQGDTVTPPTTHHSHPDDLLAILTHMTPTFPVRLFQLILEAERNQQNHIIHFNETGDAFWLHDRDSFMSELVPKHLRLRSFASFRRQLCLYGFRKRLDGSSLEYRHDMFHRERPTDLKRLRRTER